MSKITNSVVNVTPRQAGMWLAKNIDNNRKIRWNEVAEYAELMTMGRWVLNGVPIIFDADGYLIDGQHRLLACQKAGVPFRTYVTRGVEREEGFLSVDSGIGRTMGDFLNYKEFSYAYQLAAAAKTFDKMVARMSPRHPLRKKLGPTRLRSKFALRDFVNKNNGLVDSVRFACKFSTRSSKICPQSVMAALHYAFTVASNHDDASVFCERFMTGENLEKQDPIYKVRQRIIEDAMGSTAARQSIRTRDEKAWAIVRAWNYWITETTVKTFIASRGALTTAVNILKPGDALSAQHIGGDPKARKNKGAKRKSA